MGNTKETYKRKLSEDYDYFADEEMNDEKRHEVSSTSKRIKSPTKRKSRSRSRSTRQDIRDSRSWSKSPKRDFYENYTRYEVPLYQERDFYYCNDCDCRVSGIISWQQHIAGRRHAFNIGRGKGVESWQYSLRNRENYNFPKENYNMNNKRKLAEEPIQGEKNCVGLDYVLVIHKQERSIFQCFLCDICTVYRNSKQLMNHVLGDQHQRAYVEQHGKGLIQIKRLKSRHPGKGTLEESIEQKLLNPNRTETNAKPKFETGTLEDSDSLSSFGQKCSKMNYLSKRVPSNNFLRKTIEQVELHNHRYALKMTSTTIVPERRFNSPTPESVSSKVSTRAPSPNGTVMLSDDDRTNDPIPSSSQSTKAIVPDIFELAVTLSPLDCFKLVLLKLKNVELSKEDIPLLNMVANEASAVSKKFTKEFLNSMPHKEKEITVEENHIPFQNEVVEDNAIRAEEILIGEESVVEKQINVEENHIPFLNEVVEDNAIRAEEILIEEESVVEKEINVEENHMPFLNEVIEDNAIRAEEILIEEENVVEKQINVEENHLPFLNEVVEDNSIRAEEILIEEESVVESIMKNSASPENVGQNPPIVLPDSFWNSLPSSRELNNILSSIPGLNSFE